MRKASSSMSSDTTADQTSPQSQSERDQLPPALSSMWRLCKLGYTHEPRLVVLVVILTLLQAVPDALFALWLKLMADAAPRRQLGPPVRHTRGDGGVGDSDVAASCARHAPDPPVP